MTREVTVGLRWRRVSCCYDRQTRRELGVDKSRVPGRVKGVGTTSPRDMDVPEELPFP